MEREGESSGIAVLVERIGGRSTKAGLMEGLPPSFGLGPFGMSDSLSLIDSLGLVDSFGAAVLELAGGSSHPPPQLPQASAEPVVPLFFPVSVAGGSTSPQTAVPQP